MKKILVGLVLFALAGCGEKGELKVSLPSVDLTQVANTAKNLCVNWKPEIDLALVSGIPQAQTIATAVNVVCVPLAAGKVPTTLDANTAVWLSQNLVDMFALIQKKL